MNLGTNYNFYNLHQIEQDLIRVYGPQIPPDATLTID